VPSLHVDYKRTRIKQYHKEGQALRAAAGPASRRSRPGRLTYDLRRLRLHGLIARIPKTHRYRFTQTGLRTALFYTRIYARVLRPGLALVSPHAPDHHPVLTRAFPSRRRRRQLLVRSRQDRHVKT